MRISSASETALLALGRALQAENYSFTTVTPATHARVNGRAGNEWARDLAGVFGWSRPFRQELLPPSLFELMTQAEVLIPQEYGWRSRVRASTLNGMLFFHSAFPTEAADAVFFGPDTYRFAQTIQRHLAQQTQPLGRAVDIGCGAGPGAILISAAQPATEVLAVDINDQALQLTRVNAALAYRDAVHTCHSNLLHDVPGEFDLIVANPPYLNDPAERAYRHGGGALGAALSLAIVDTALERLAPGGSLLLYTGVAMKDGQDPFWQAVRPSLTPARFSCHYQELDPDVFGEELLEPAYADADRIAAVELKVTRAPAAFA